MAPESASPEREKKEEREIYDLFRIGVFAKGVQAVIELIASAFVFLIPLRSIIALADHLTEDELFRDPGDLVANHVHDLAHGLSIGGKNFIAAYLLVQGIVKLTLVFALLSGKRWAYPAALGILGALMLYQAYRIYLHHSPILALATAFDAVVFYLIYREYRIVERAARAKESA